MIDTARLVTELALRDNLSSGLGRAMNSVSGFQKGIGQMGRGLGQVGAGLARVGTIAAGALVGGLTASVKVAADFESQMNIINTIAQTTPQALGDIGAGIRGLARETGADLGDLTAAYYDLLSAGVSVADAQSVLTTATELATGSLGTTSEGVDLLTTAMNSYNLTADQAAVLSDQFAKAVELGKVTLSDIAPVYATVAPLAATMGIETNEIAAAFGQLTAKGVPASEVATQMRSALKALIEPSAELNALQEELGVNFGEIAKEKGLQVALQQMFEAVNGDTEAFNKLFGRIEGFNFALAVTGPNAASFADTLDQVTNSAGTLDDQVSARRQGLSYQLGILKANLKDIGITIGTALLPKLTPLVTELATFLTDNQSKIESFASGVADAIGDLIDAGKSGDFDPFIDAMRTIAQVGGKVVDIFLKLPPSVQAAIVTGAAINRLSGGLLASGAANLAGGLIRTAVSIVFQRGASPATPLFVANVGGIGGGAVAGGGIGTTIIKFLGLATAAGFGAIIGSAIGHLAFDPTVQPAVEFETTRFERLLQSNDPAALQRGLDAITQGLVDIDADNPIMQALVGEQITLLQEQRDLLQGRLGEVAGNTLQTAALTARQVENGRRITNLAQMDIAQSQQILSNLQIQSAARAAESARHLQSLATQAVSLTQIAAKETTVTVNNRNVVSFTASGTASVINTYTQLRVGGGHTAGAP